MRQHVLKSFSKHLHTHPCTQVYECSQQKKFLCYKKIMKKREKKNKDKI